MIEHPASISALPTSISGLIDRWPAITDFADEVGCGYEAARQMRRRQSIAPQHWAQVVAASRRRGIAGVSYEWLAGATATDTAQGEAA
ncbi:hypothetical protein [Mesorhizobium sp. LjNodule214]|uniref:hypothetical protein n=1 Tax=Mesorhizobium sp. LjNodule214 TaxID=3342252 RepID=UPI003ECC84B7